MTDSKELANGIGAILIIACIVGLIYRIFGGEREGTVNNIDNCQIEITTKDAFYNRIFSRFICEYNKTTAGKIIRGTCYHADFDNDGNCTKLVTYEKTPDITCPDGQYVNDNGNCECNSESQYMIGKKCYDKCGANASYNYSDKLCYCDIGYENNSNNQCVKIVPEAPYRGE